MAVTWATNRVPSTRRERLEMDLSLGLETLRWCRVNRMMRSVKWLQACIQRIREATDA